MNDPLFSVVGDVVLVSGASRGIGRALAAGFAQRGARVVITGRDAGTLEAAALEIDEFCRTEAVVPDDSLHRVVPIVCDVADESAIGRLIDQTLSACGRIDTLLNVAGVNKRQRVETFTPAEFDFILNINLRGAFFLAQAVGRQFIAQGGGGTIVNIDSLNTYAPLKGVLPYAMSKAGISMMTRGMALEWGRHGIRVNALAPGFVLTDMTRKLWSQPHMQQWADANTPLRRLGEVEDMIGCAVYLASRASAFMTGQVVYVDGGMSAGIAWPIELP